MYETTSPPATASLSVLLSALLSPYRRQRARPVAADPTTASPSA